MTTSAPAVAAYVALGANLGDRVVSLQAAIHEMAARFHITGVSSIYETEPMGYVNQPRFLNAVAAISTTLDPRSVLGTLLEIEAKLGRVRTFPNAPRTLDLDVLLYGDQVIGEPLLTVPHPRMHERAFVLVPFAEIGESVQHPVLKKTIGQLASNVEGRRDVRLFGRLDKPLRQD